MKQEKYYVNAVDVSCDGGSLGHPKVHLRIPESGSVVCPYCNRLFVRRKPGVE